MVTKHALLIMLGTLVALPQFGCAVPGTALVVLDYDKPPQASSEFTMSAFGSKASASMDLPILKGAKSIKLMASSSPLFDFEFVRKSPDIGPGISLPQVRPGDPWSIVLKRVRIQDHGNWFASGEVALLVRVTARDGSPTDNQWLLAALETDVAKESKLNFDNIVIWSGFSTETVVIDIRLVSLKKTEKAEINKYLDAVGKIAGFVPQYGQLAQLLLKFGAEINNKSPDYQILLQYGKGFYPEHRAKYAPYAMLSSATVGEHGGQLWFDDSDRAGNVMAGNKELKENWVVFEISKGLLRSFAQAKAKSLDEVITIAESWSSKSTPNAGGEIYTAYKKMVSAAEMERIRNTVDFGNARTIKRALGEIRKHVGEQYPIVEPEHLSQFVSLLRSYMPEDKTLPEGDLATPEKVDSWIKLVGEIERDYSYDKKTYLWVTKEASRSGKVSTRKPASLSFPESEAISLDNVLQGLHITSLEAAGRSGLKFIAKSGVMVTSVAPGSAAEASGIKPEEIIMEINRHQVATVKEFLSLSSTINADEVVVLLVGDQQGSHRFVALNPK